MSAPPKWLFNQSGVIPYIRTDGDLQIILITNKTTNKWVIPKGVVELDLTPRDSAVQEAYGRNFVLAGAGRVIKIADAF